MNLFRTLTLLALAMIIAMPANADDKKADGEKKAAAKKDGEKKPGAKKPGNKDKGGGIAGIVKNLAAKGVELSEEQQKKLQAALADRKKQPQSELQKKVQELRKKAAAEGKKGKDLNAAVFGQLSDDEKAELRKQGGGFRTVLQSILTEEQKAKLAPKGKKPGAKKGDGAKKKAAEKKGDS